MILHVTDAKYVDTFRVHIWFNNGQDAEIDLSQSLDGPIFQPLQDIEYFKSFVIEGHTLAWPNGADFAPEYLRSLAKSNAWA